MPKEFSGTKVYYSGSLKGVVGCDPYFAFKLVDYMKKGGASVLSEHVAARSVEDKDILMAQNIGISLEELKGDLEPWYRIRKQDMLWVEQATHVVAEVSGPSHGVGAEIERALLKPRLGLNKTPILCLVKEDVLTKLSWMIRGVNVEESKIFKLKTYNSTEEAQEHVFTFLTTRS